MDAKQSHNLAMRAYRKAVFDHKRKIEALAYRDATQANEPYPRHPTLPVGLVDIDYILDRKPWHVRIADSRKEVVRILREAREASPQEAWVDEIVRRTGRVPYNAMTAAKRELRRHLDDVRSGPSGHGLKLAEASANYTRAMTKIWEAA